MMNCEFAYNENFNLVLPWYSEPEEKWSQLADEVALISKKMDEEIEEVGLDVEEMTFFEIYHGAVIFFMRDYPNKSVEFFSHCLLGYEMICRDPEPVEITSEAQHAPMLKAVEHLKLINTLDKLV
jgi:hypothetical protein